MSSRKGGGSGCRYRTTEDAAINRALRTYNRQADRRGLRFELSKEQFSALVRRNCFYCGKEPAVNSYSEDSKVKIPMTGVDRKDSSSDYTIDNCVPCCGMCNLAKLDYPRDVFLEWIQRVANHQNRIKAVQIVDTKPEEDDWLAEMETE